MYLVHGLRPTDCSQSFKSTEDRTPEMERGPMDDSDGSAHPRLILRNAGTEHGERFATELDINVLEWMLGYVCASCLKMADGNVGHAGELRDCTEHVGKGGMGA